VSDQAQGGGHGFLAVAVLLALAHWVVLVFSLPVFAGLPRWFWDFSGKPAGSPAVLAALVGLPLATLATIVRTPERTRLHLALLFLLGVALQFALALTEYRGLAALRDRMVYTGHAEFAEQAVRVDDVGRLVREYEPLVAGGELGRYAPSKPPGQLLLYVATERMANAAQPEAGRGARLRRLRTFAAWTWPLASMFGLFPLFHLGRLLADEDTTIRAGLLYVFVPSVQLVTLHTDQAFFPLLFLVPLALAAEGGRRGSGSLGAAAGVFAFLAAFGSFGLLPALPLAAVLVVAVARDRGTDDAMDGAGGKPWYGQAARAGAGLLAGFVLSYAAFRVLLGYDALVRFRRATAYHEAWKGGTSGFLADLGFAYVDAIEFALWLGLPLAALAVLAAARSLRRVVQGTIPAADVLGLAVAAVLLVLAVFGKTQGEVARLWLFLVPLVCLAAAREAGYLFGSRPGRAFALLLLLQGGTVYLMKRFMDFA